MLHSLTLLPYLNSSGEYKTKPTQHSVKELDKSVSNQILFYVDHKKKYLKMKKRKIALFTNVDYSAVISAIDVDSIYKIPYF